MKDFKNVDRYDVTYDHVEYLDFPLIEEGPWVRYEDYQDLLQEYNELKYRIDSLEK